MSGNHNLESDTMKLPARPQQIAKQKIIPRDPPHLRRRTTRRCREVIPPSHTCGIGESPSNIYRLLSPSAARRGPTLEAPPVLKRPEDQQDCPELRRSKVPTVLRPSSRAGTGRPYEESWDSFSRTSRLLTENVKKFHRGRICKNAFLILKLCYETVPWS